MTTLVLLGAPVTIRDLKQYTNAPSDARQLRADLQAWAADALTQHRTFHDTFLFGCSAHEGIALAALGGVDEVREEISAFVGIVVGAELRRLRAVGPAIAAVDWAAAVRVRAKRGGPRARKRARRWAPYT